MKKVIVSRNYLDRESPFPWLVRLKGQAPETAVPVEHVHVKDFRFCTSSSYESGFGCNIVGEGILAHSGEIPSGMRPLQFTGYNFANGNGDEVEHGRMLSLSWRTRAFCTPEPITIGASAVEQLQGHN